MNWHNLYKRTNKKHIKKKRINGGPTYIVNI